MSTFTRDDWIGILSRLNSLLLRSEEWRSDLSERAISSGWCGMPPASENEILKTEKRLGITLPSSYRSFLTITNGWRPFSSFIEQLLPVQEIERFRVVDSEDSKLIQELYQDKDSSDEEYLDYKTTEHNVAMRSRYYPESLLVGKKWDSGGGELVLLNPHIVSRDGEWETIFFANWIPGNRRYRSFYSYVEEAVNAEEKLASHHSP